MILMGKNKNTGIKTCPTTNLPTINPTSTSLRAILGHRSDRLVTNHLNHDTTCDVSIQLASFIISAYLATLWAGGSRVQFLTGTRDLSSPKHNDQLCGPLSLIRNGQQNSSPGAKWLGHRSDHVPSIAKVKNDWTYTATLPVCIHVEIKLHPLCLSFCGSSLLSIN